MKFIDIQEKKLAELKATARSMKLTGYSALRKQDLIHLILEALAEEDDVLRHFVRLKQKYPDFSLIWVTDRFFPKSLNEAEESERMTRLYRFMKQAIDIFGSEEKARKWFETPLPSLGGKTPLECAETEDGAQKVEDVLGRIAHGVFS